MVSSSLLTVSRKNRVGEDSRSEAAYRLIKHKIITSELPPACVLNEAELMEALQLGRTPIREALQRLALEDLVVILPRRGTIVADLNMTDLQKIFEVRIELEVQAVRLAAKRVTAQQMAEMDLLFANAESIIASGDNRQLIELDHQAHRLLARAAHNEFLEETLDRLYNHVLRLWYVSIDKVGRLREAIEEHRDIIAAVRAGDGERAAAIMRAHISEFQKEFAKV